MRLSRIRHLIFAMLFGFAFTGYVQRSSVAVAAERMMPELGPTQVQVGWLFTAFLFIYAVLQFPGGLVGQVWGARRMLTAIGLVTVIASILTAASPWLAAAGVLFIALLLARSLLGVAQAALVIASVPSLLLRCAHPGSRRRPRRLGPRRRVLVARRRAYRSAGSRRSRTPAALLRPPRLCQRTALVGRI
jgi:MFS family permease